ncbi:TPA: DMT family transporter [Legionella anisa]|uniref:EamA family transporter n=1 Tax=Legionella anisa TaxID=28082 RepID=A0AAX0WVY8_9GAMM|nr:EamA family transporter [Legionella anisa]AWN73284.1 EamA family transporter [Legionella anisa]MBN5936685.1 EamA family transporter [Legionella anisa]MCW8423053.1 DMT family transporter [Legionella anisa]MCW8447804.1 DMT family transporter [Legionella anisa]PNL62807.1 EamA family transporter [Legionella anisa]
MQSFKVSCVVTIAIVLWASAFVGIRIGLTAYSPGALALLRFMVASLCMLIIYYSLGIKKRVAWGDRLQLLLTGMAGIGIYNICLNYGELSVSVGIASFVLGLMPVLTVILSLIFLQEKLARGVWVGIIISILGLALLAIDNNSEPGMQQGILAILVSALMGAILTIIQKRFVSVYHPVAIIAWVMWGGTLLLSIFLPDMFQQIQIADFQTTTAVIYMGIFPAALAYLAWAYALKYLSASNASIMLYALPVVSTLMGFLLLDEQPSLLSLVGCSITLAGAFIANRFQTRFSFTQEKQLSN